MLGFFTQAALPRQQLVRDDGERTVADAARSVGPLSPAKAANVAQALQLLLPQAVQAPASGPAALLPATATPEPELVRSLTAALAAEPTEASVPAAPLAPVAPAPLQEVSAQGSAASSAADDLELFPLVEVGKPPPKGSTSTALWVGLGLLGAAVLGVAAVSVARARR